MLKLTLMVMTYFQKVTELQHVTKTAEALQVAQPTVSRVINSIEKDFNVPLFTRKGRNITLTPFGEILLKHTNRILEEVELTKRELDTAKQQEQQTVRLSISAASKLLPVFLAGFKKEYPEVNFELLLRGANERPSSIGGLNTDLELTSDIKPMTNDHSVTLFREELLMALPQSDPRSKMISVNLNDFAEDGFICLHKGQSLRKIIEYYCRKAGFTPRVDLESDSLLTVREFIRAGMGISLVPQITWSDISCGEQVTLIPITSPRCYRYITLTWDGSVPLSRPAVLLKDYIIRYFADYAKTKAVIY